MIQIKQEKATEIIVAYLEANKHYYLKIESYFRKHDLISDDEDVFAVVKNASKKLIEHLIELI